MNTTPPVLPAHISFLAIEGVIGVGKTSFCRLLGDAWDARLILEAADENPFLPKFYQDRKMYAFQTQAWFLLSRYRQVSEMVAQQDLFHAHDDRRLYVRERPDICQVSI